MIGCHRVLWRDWLSLCAVIGCFGMIGCSCVLCRDWLSLGAFTWLAVTVCFYMIGCHWVLWHDWLSLCTLTWLADVSCFNVIGCRCVLRRDWLYVSFVGSSCVVGEVCEASQVIGHWGADRPMERNTHVVLLPCIQLSLIHDPTRSYPRRNCVIIAVCVCRADVACSTAALPVLLQPLHEPLAEPAVWTQGLWIHALTSSSLIAVVDKTWHVLLHDWV